MLKTLAARAYNEARGLLEIRYTLADTRVPHVSLTDHLLLTSGLAVSMVTELLSRGKSAEDITGEPLVSEDLILVTRIASLLHDIGKIEDYRGHVQRGVQMARDWLQGEAVPRSITELILRAVQRHQLDYSPESLLEKIVCLADSMASAGDRPQLQREIRSYDELERLTGRNLDLERDIFGEQPGLSLILGDVDRIKHYVFDTSRLPCIRGASEILNDLNLEEIPTLIARHLAPECLIYAGGGSFLAIAPISLAEALRQEVYTCYSERTQVATLTCVTSRPLRYLDFARGCNPYVDGEVTQLANKAQGFGRRLMANHPVVRGRKRGFGEIIALLAADLRRAKASKAFVPVVETLPLIRRCSYCGIRPAEHTVEGADILCEICNTRRKRGAMYGRAKFADAFKEWVQDENGKEIAARAPSHLEEIAGANGYVGFIYADGNNIGALLEEKALTPAAFRHIAEVLRQATREALFEALYKAFDQHLAGLSSLPFEIVNIGGDDVSLFVQAPWAWDVALRFLEAFEERTATLAQELGVGTLTASVGLCVAKKNYPVYYTERLAESLLRQAKGRAKRDPAHHVSAICHLYLTSSLAAEQADDVLRAYCIADAGRPKRRLTSRPYTVPEARLVGEVTSALEELFSRSQFYALVQALEQGLFASINFFLYQLSRIGGENRHELVSQLKQTLAQLGYDPQFLIWKWDEHEACHTTCLYDALELLKMRGGSS